MIKLALFLVAVIGVCYAKPFSEEVGFSTREGDATKDNPDYYLSDKELSWYAANYYCYSQGWALVSTESFEATTLLKGFREIYAITGTSYWSAGNRLDGKKWRWGLAGQEFCYINWAIGQGSDDCEKNCLLLDKTVDNFWFQEDCEKKQRYICQKSIKRTGIETD